MTSRSMWAEVLSKLAVIVTMGIQPSIATAEGMRIDEPREDAVIRSVSGDLLVEVKLDQVDLTGEMRFRLFMDGCVVVSNSYLPIFQLHDVPPGSHVLQAQIVDRAGVVLETSEPVRFVMRTEASP